LPPKGNRAKAHIVMTPFELSLESELNIEWQKFANDWLFKWHGMTYEGGVTDVDDFRGGRIHYGGIKFGYQQQQIFWQAIDRYLNQKIHQKYKDWERETYSYPIEIKRSSLEGAGRLLQQFVSKIVSRAVETDRALRGRGHPSNVPGYDPSGSQSRAQGEINRLWAAHRGLLETVSNAVPTLVKLSRKQRVENFLSNHRGIISIIAILVAIIFGLVKFFHG
jgi:hypothetical protein